MERANQTPRLRVDRLFQDRLIKEMRLPNISSMEVAQAFLPAFMLTWNARFAVEPRDKSRAHRPWTKMVDELDLTLARREEADTVESADVHCLSPGRRFARFGS